MNEELEELLKELRAYRNDMVARNYPFQEISDIITRWETKETKTISEQSQDELEPITDEIDEDDIKNFLDEAEREKKELEERKSKEWTKGYDKWKKDK
jgi:Mg/Co/Ni transporter MgtE